MKKTLTIFTALIATLILSATFFAVSIPSSQEPARIVAKSEGVVGELIKLQLEATVDDCTWLVIPASEDFEVYANGTKAVFSARAVGNYLFIAAYCHNGKIFLLRHALTISGPTPPPTPPGPDASILTLLPFWCHELNVSPQTQATLSTNFSSVATRAASGEFKTVQDMITATATLNKGSDATELLDRITSYIVAQASKGKLETINDHIILWNKISAGLKPPVAREAHGPANSTTKNK